MISSLNLFDEDAASSSVFPTCVLLSVVLFFVGVVMQFMKKEWSFLILYSLHVNILPISILYIRYTIIHLIWICTGWVIVLPKDLVLDIPFGSGMWPLSMPGWRPPCRVIPCLSNSDCSTTKPRIYCVMKHSFNAFKASGKLLKIVYRIPRTR